MTLFISQTYYPISLFFWECVWYGLHPEVYFPAFYTFSGFNVVEYVLGASLSS